MKQRSWIAIVTTREAEPQPIVLLGHDGTPARFESPGEIEQWSIDHELFSGVWVAYNFLTGETEMIG